MKKVLFLPLQVGLCTFGYLHASIDVTHAQVTPDGTVNTQVNQNGNVAEITGGQTRGGNLFHSFQDFSILTGNEAFFDNANSISNIFSRVTGGNISNIDGTIRANGSASLFLINPAGIIFGESARLDIGGSFYGSSASSILFEDGEFSAADLQNPPLLTINAPIGLSFRDEPGDIVNRSFVQNDTGEFVGLEVAPGKDITLLGGNINFEAGEITASGGNIELGGLSEAGTVGINEDGSLSFPEAITKADVNLNNAADIDVRGIGGGNIIINARNLSLSAGESGNSVIRAGIIANSNSTEAQAGNITINAAENIVIDNSGIQNIVANEGIGNAGNIIIDTNSLEAINGGQVNASTFGRGNAGAINITATGDIILDGENSNGFPSGVTSGVNSSGVGDAGGVIISTTNLNLTNGARVGASTFGEGNAGAINITATGDITLDGENSNGFSSGVSSRVNPGAVGDAGGVTISTTNLNLTNGGNIDASTVSQGNAGAIEITATGDITLDGENSNGFSSNVASQVFPGMQGDAGGVTISTTNLNLTNGGTINASTLGEGNAGAINITATGDITVDGENSNGSLSSVASRVNPGAVGNAAGITISTTNLNLNAGGRIDTSTFSAGNAGAINITTTGDITADGEGSLGFVSDISSQVFPNAEGDAAGITISTNDLNLTNGATVAASTFGQGNAGTINITTTGDITADGEGSLGSPSRVASQVGFDAVGDAAGISISTNDLNLTNGGTVDASTVSQGNAGAINITAINNIRIDGENSLGFPSGVTSQVFPGAVGNAGGVTISTTNLNLATGGRVDASTASQGDAGTINIIATGDITADGEGSLGFLSGINSVVDTDAVGNSGGVIISTANLNLTNGARVNASTTGQGNAGNITIEAHNINLISEGSIETATQSNIGISGIINLQITEDITLRDNSLISARAFAEADGGNLNIDTRFIIAFPGGNNDIIANAQQGNGGIININAESLFGIEERPLNSSTNDINASSEFSLDGNVTINTPDLNPVQGTIELQSNLVDPGETTQQACQANREEFAKNGLTIGGQGGIPAEPGLPLNSLNVTVNGETNFTSIIPAPIETSLGKIQPARGIKVTESGKIILTAYRTNNLGDKPNGMASQRLIKIKRNCGSV